MSADGTASLPSHGGDEPRTALWLSRMGNRCRNGCLRWLRVPELRGSRRSRQRGQRGGMLWLSWKKLSGSQVRLAPTRRR